MVTRFPATKTAALSSDKRKPEPVIRKPLTVTLSAVMLMTLPVPLPRISAPGYGRIIRHRYYAQFSRTLGTLMENGIPLLKALDLVTEIAGNRFLEKKLVDVRRAVIDGANLSAALAAQKLFPELFTDMMAVGEQTGHFAQTMQTIADVYERELDRTVQIISALIPPVIIALIAVVVGFVVYSILSAVFEMTSSLQVRPH